MAPVKAIVSALGAPPTAKEGSLASARVPVRSRAPARRYLT